MFRSLIWYLYFPLGLLIYLPKIKKLESKKGKITDLEFFTQANDLAREWSGKYIEIAGIKVEVIGEENIPKDRTCLFVSNHQSNFDTAVYLRYLGVPISFIAKKELTKIPILSSMMKNMNAMFIDRKDIRNSAQTMLQAMEYIKQGYNVFVYPEGTRGDSPEMAEFPSTAIKIATKTKAPIVPMTISGTYDVMEGPKNVITPAKVRLYIHKPIETENLSKEELKNVHNTVYELIKSELVLDLNKK